MKRVAFHTLGCKMNFHETAYMEEQFRKKGYAVVPFRESADVYVVNTCTVTSVADSKCRQAIRRAKRRNPNSLVVATGCLSEVYPKELARVEEVDLILGNVEKFSIVDHVEDALRGSSERVRVKGIWSEKRFHPIPVEGYGERSRAFVKVQQGCELFCSYCIIPRARGRAVSEEPEKVVEQVRGLVERGYREVVLTGTQLGGYGKDLGNGVNLSLLLRKLLEIEGLSRLRLSSVEPVAFDGELIDIITSSERIAPHFHIPLQSGSRKVLSLMRRDYSPSFYESLILEIARRRPDACIGTDVMVGFPGEGEKEFEDTFNLIRRLPLSYLHVFPYSPRRGTVAFSLKGAVPWERASILRELGREKSFSYRSRFLGKERDAVLVKEKVALTDNYINVNLTESCGHPGRGLRVKIVKVGRERNENLGVAV